MARYVHKRAPRLGQYHTFLPRTHPCRLHWAGIAPSWSASAMVAAGLGTSVGRATRRPVQSGCAIAEAAVRIGTFVFNFAS